VSSKDCPFYAGSKITDPRFFVGRRDLLKTLCDRLTGAQPTSINIVGRHRTGKSSLLLQFVNTFRQRVENPDRFLVVYLSLQDAGCDSQDKFYGSIAKLLAVYIPSNNRALQKLLTVKQWDSIKFNQLIQACKQQEFLPVLCIDNFEELLERKEQFPNNFYDNLRSLLDGNHLMLVMSSCEMLDYYSKQKRITSDFFNLFQTIDLNDGFSLEDANSLVVLKNGMGEGLTPDLQKKALAWGKKEPYLLQLASQKLWEMQTDGKSLKWAEKEFKIHANRFSFQPKSPLLSDLYKLISQLGKWVLWFNKNRKEMQEFWAGLLLIAVIFVILLSFSYGAINFEQIKSLVFPKSGK
jgi:AAA+ ATPase superfamily predicted ATPase